MADCRLWRRNGECSMCGNPTDPGLGAAETGLRYCSTDCGSWHVNRDMGPRRRDACGALVEVERP